MKKLVLGLLLTAGICGKAWASDLKITKLEKSQNLLIKKHISSVKGIGGGLDLFLKPGECLIVTTITIRDSNGALVDTKTVGTIGEGSICNGNYYVNRDVFVSVEGHN